MARSIEIELKFEILDSDEVAQFVRPLKVIEQKRIVDVYLDTKEADLFKRGIFVRIRNGSKFDIKFNQEDIGKSLDDNIEHTHCDEVSNPLPLTPTAMASINETLKFLGLAPMAEPTLENLVKRNKLIESVVVDKQRSSYDAGEFHIDIDTVKDLGEYLEIEKMTDETDNRQEVLNKMKDRLKGLQLRHVDVGYNELYWRKHDFDLYLQGKYLLIEDRKKYRAQSLQDQMPHQSDVTFEEVNQLIWKHLVERDWHHNPPRGLATSIALEAAELLEHYQWRDEPVGSKEEIAAELADVLIYSFQLAQALDIDLTAAIKDKLAKAAKKYPAEQFKGKDNDEKKEAWLKAKLEHREQKKGL